MVLKRFTLSKKRFLVAGVGLHGGGRATIAYLLSHHAKVRITDIKSRKDLIPSLHTLPRLHGSFGNFSKKDVRWADIIIKNPGVPSNAPILRYAKQKQKKIASDIQLFYDAIGKRPEICITGTRGKSTTTALIGHLLSSRKQVYVAGNIRTSVLADVSVAKKRVVVLELSSWQIEDAAAMRISPYVGVFTNIYQDHLNRYSSMAAYVRAKKLLFAYQTPHDYIIANYDQKLVRNFALNVKSQKLFFSLKRLPKAYSGCYVQKNAVWLRNKGVERRIISIHDFPVTGDHNIQNICAAISAVSVFGLPLNQIAKKIKSFKALSGRQEIIRVWKQKTFINDTTATSPDALVACILSLVQSHPKSHIHAIVGGATKNLSYAPLRRIRKFSNIKYYFLQGSATRDLMNQLPMEKSTVPYCTLLSAVQSAYCNAQPGDIIVLTPGAASFGMFKHEFDRGDEFVRIIKSLK